MYVRNIQIYLYTTDIKIYSKNLIFNTDRSGGKHFDGYKSIILSKIWYFYGCMEISKHKTRYGVQYYVNRKRTMYGMIENEKG